MKLPVPYRYQPRRFFCAIPKKQRLPGILDDISAEVAYNDHNNNDQKVTIKGFIIRMQCATAFRDTDGIRIAVKFDDDYSAGTEEFDNFFKYIG